MQEKQAFERIEVSRAEALEIFAENKFKATFFLNICSFDHLYLNISVLLISYIWDILLILLNTFELYAQVEIINELPEDKTITVYRCGPLVDLCRGPHIPNTSFVKAFACLKVFFLLLCTELQVLLMKFSTLELILHVNIRLQHHIGEEKQTVRAYREYMESLSLILNVSRYII